MRTRHALLLAALPFIVHATPAVAGRPFDDGRPVAIVDSGEIAEASGLAVSRKNPAIVWVHNDSGEQPRLFAIGLDGKLVSTVNLVGAKARDWEGMAICPGPTDGVDYLYVGDVGDNFAREESISVYRVPEPDTTKLDESVDLDGVVALELRYPDGAHDAEALMCDPRTGDLFVITKDVGGNNEVFRAAAPQSRRQPTILEKIATVTFPGETASELAATGADISSSGELIIIRSYNRASIWKRGPEQSVAEALAEGGRPVLVPGPPVEPQGEAIALTPDAVSYYTLGEGLAQPLFRFDRRIPE